MSNKDEDFKFEVLNDEAFIFKNKDSNIATFRCVNNCPSKKDNFHNKIFIFKNIKNLKKGGRYFSSDKKIYSNVYELFKFSDGINIKLKNIIFCFLLKEIILDDIISNFYKPLNIYIDSLSGIFVVDVFLISDKSQGLILKILKNIYDFFFKTNNYDSIFNDDNNYFVENLFDIYESHDFIVPNDNKNITYFEFLLQLDLENISLDKKTLFFMMENDNYVDLSSLCKDNKLILDKNTFIESDLEGLIFLSFEKKKIIFCIDDDDYENNNKIKLQEYLNFIFNLSLHYIGRDIFTNSEKLFDIELQKNEEIKFFEVKLSKQLNINNFLNSKFFIFNKTINGDFIKFITEKIYKVSEILNNPNAKIRLETINEEEEEEENNGAFKEAKSIMKKCENCRAFLFP